MDSPRRHGRMSLANINAGFRPSSSRSRSSSPSKAVSLAATLSRTFRLSWPPGTLSRLPEKSGNFTIRISDFYLEKMASSNPQEHAHQILASMAEIEKIRLSNHDTSDELANFIVTGIIEVIFGSNAIETVGGAVRITIRLCREIFDGKIPDVETIDERSNEYAEELETLVNSQRKTDVHSVIRSRHEIVQHALALQYLIDAIVGRDLLLSEDMIKETHRILMRFSEHADIAGVYRTHDEAASHGLRDESDKEYEKRVADCKRLKPNRPAPERKQVPLLTSKFVRGKSVAYYMKKFVETYEEMVDHARQTGDIDVVDFAARLATDFVCIHPFEDGNGRLCRMILNVMSIKYAGCTVPIGVEEEEREEYLKEAWLANKVFTEEEKNDVEHSGREAHHGMGRSILGKMSLRLSETKAKLMAKFA